MSSEKFTSKLDVELLKHLEGLIGVQKIKTDALSIEKYSHDETEDLKFAPNVVVFPENTKDVSLVAQFCNTHKIPLTVMGARTGLSGAALPIYGGIALSTERLNKILDIDEKNLQVTVEPGVITQVLQESVAAKGLFYPPDPSSRGSCFIGGNLAHNSGGPKAVKYGVTREYVLNLELVLADGNVIWTGANVLKNSTGYSLTQLVVGSEGTLGIITKAVLKLIPHPQKTILLLVPFYNAEEACRAVSEIFRAGITPSAIEFMERDALDWVCKFDSEINITIAEDVQAHLLIELDGNDLEQLQLEAEKLTEVLSSFNTDEVLYAEDDAQKNQLWRMRRRVGEAVKSNSIYKEEDTVVPRYELPKLLKGVKDIGAKYGFKSVCYGHAGDGNLHINILKGNLSDEFWNSELKLAIRELFKLVIELKGTLSGEHGIGLVQKEYMDIAFPPHHLALFKAIKQVFDPNNILNPGKMIPL